MTENLWLYCVCLREWNQIRKSVHFVILHLSRGFPAAKTVNKYLFFPHPTNPHYSATLFLSSLVNGVYGLLDDLSSQPSNCWWCQKVKYIVWVRRDLLIPPTTSAGRITNNKSDHSFKTRHHHRLSLSIWHIRCTYLVSNASWHRNRNRSWGFIAGCRYD